ncbi:histone-lysine n-methyltransferase setmar-like protein [Elysia marginata]|uniref:Histone-lysine n-methyltransferase setmar-like protein n=1 Tax=Elysia marginata TaxID=1093978 RepID=A0AAV4HF56_9GAST|nr:histone-lysine n-methyltransferase setmar-like protein [Elysia marginata]
MGNDTERCNASGTAQYLEESANSGSHGTLPENGRSTRKEAGVCGLGPYLYKIVSQHDNKTILRIRGATKSLHLYSEVITSRKVSARWVPRMLTEEMQRKSTCAEPLKHYEEEGEEFIQRFVTGKESWVHHNDPERKRKSVEYRHKSSPSPRKFKVVASAR